MFLRLCTLAALSLGGLAGLHPARADDAEDAAVRTLVQRYFDAIAQQDLKALGECLAPSFATPQIASREAFLARQKEVFTRVAPTKYQAKVLRLRHDPDGSITARVQFQGKLRLKGGQDEVDDEGYWSMIARRQAGSWKLTAIVDASLDVALAARRAKTREERLAVFRAEGDDFLKYEFLTKLFQEVEQLLEGGSLEKAELFVILGEDAAAAIEDPKDRQLYQILARWNRGGLLLGQDRYDDAVTLLRELMEQCRKDGWKAIEMDISASLGVALAKQGNYREAVRLLEEYLVHAKKLAQPPKPGEGGVSLAPLFEAKLLLMEAGLYNALGVTYTELGEYTRALESLNRAKASATRFNKQLLLLNILKNIANVHAYQERLSEALQIYEQVLTSYRQLKLPYREVETLQAMGMTLTEQGRHGDAERHLEQARTLAAKLRYPRGEGFALASLALLRMKQGMQEDADRYNREALKLFRQTRYEAGIARGLRLQALLALQAKKSADAQKALDECLTLVEAGGSQSEAAQNAVAVALLYVQLGDAKKAKAAFQAAETAYRKMGNLHMATLLRYKKSLILTPDGKIHQDLTELIAAERDILQLRDPLLMRLFHEDKGFAHYQMKEWEAAVQDFETAAAYLEQRAAGVEDPLLRASYVGSSADLPFLYIALAATRAQQGKPEEVFRASERGKARALIQLLERTPQTIRKGLPLEESQQETRLREAVAAATRELHSTLRFASTDTRRREQVTQELRDAQSRYEEFQRQLTLRYPDLRGRRGDPPAVNLTELQRTLFAQHPDVAILSYVPSWDRTLIVVLTRGERADGPARVTVRSAQVIYRDLEQAAEEYAQACQSPEAGKPESERLWEWLITPVEPDLTGIKHLVFVPAHPLLAFPFQALRKPDSPYLIEQYAVSYAPSVAALMQLRRQADRARAEPGKQELVPVVAVGGVKFSRELRPLPASGPEVEKIGALLGPRSRVLLSERATRPEVMRLARSGRILHFATHGLPNETRPLFSSIALTPTAQDDGRLYAHDVMNLGLAADLVVLSACQTARGREYRGEGTIGMAWAFFVAGVPTTVVTQWSVADASTADLMASFYQQSNHAPTRVEALRQAQLQRLASRETRHPFFWAPFIVVGDWR